MATEPSSIENASKVTDVNPEVVSSNHDTAAIPTVSGDGNANTIKTSNEHVDSSPVKPADSIASNVTSPTQPAVPTREPANNDAVSALQAMFPGMDSTSKLQALPPMASISVNVTSLVISEVLAAHGGNADAASMALLELNNPDIAPPPAAGGNGRAGGDTAAAAQMHADEEYARQLMAQMEHEHMQEYGRPLDSAQERQHRSSSGASGREQQANYNNLNYVPRQRNRHGQPAGGSAQQQQQYADGQQGDGQQAGFGQWLGGQTGPDGRWKHQDELDQLTDQFNKFADSELDSLFASRV